MINKLNYMTQGNGKPAKDYYEWVLQVCVKLQEFHAYMFRNGGLERQIKEAFFNGLCPEYRAMVVHHHDDPNTTITELLTAIHECEENEENSRQSRQMEYAKAYPPSTSRPSYGGVRKNDTMTSYTGGNKYGGLSVDKYDLHGTKVTVLLWTTH